MYPVALEFDADPKVANWRPLVQWLLGIPHLIIAQVLGQVASVVAVISWFAILFTGVMPPGLAAFQCLVIRYNARALSYALWLRESYPPFEFPMGPADPRTDPVRVDFVAPSEPRNRLTVGLRFLWIVPIALFAFAVSLAACAVSLASFFARALHRELPGRDARLHGPLRPPLRSLVCLRVPAHRRVPAVRRRIAGVLRPSCPAPQAAVRGAVLTAVSVGPHRFRPRHHEAQQKPSQVDRTPPYPHGFHHGLRAARREVDQGVDPKGANTGRESEPFQRQANVPNPLPTPNGTRPWRRLLVELHRRDGWGEPGVVTGLGSG